MPDLQSSATADGAVWIAINSGSRGAQGDFSPAEAERWMKNTGATLLAAPIHIDVLEHPIPEDEAVARFESTLETA